MAGSLYFPPRALEQDVSGNALSGALLYCYAPPGTSTPKNVYTTSVLNVAHANPVVADAAGRFAAIYMDGTYNFILKDAAGTTIWSENNVQGVSASNRFGSTVALTATTAIDSSYASKHITCTNAITLNLDLLATLAEGFEISVRNDGTANVTIDPNGSELINGVTTWILPPQASAIVVAGATAWSAIDTTGIAQGITNVTSAATIDLDAIGNNKGNVTGTTDITAITLRAGQIRWVKFAGALTLTNGASLILPGGANIKTAAGDTAVFVGEGSGVVRCISFTPASGLASVAYLPQNSQSGAYTTVIGDAGKHLLHPSADTTARIFTIDSNANVPYPVGTVITFVNQASAGVVTIAITTDTMRMAVSGATGSRTLAANGIATALKVTSTEWLISGSGLG